MAFTPFLFPRSDSTVAAVAQRAVYVTTHLSVPLNGTQRAARAQQSFRARRADHTRSPIEISRRTGTERISRRTRNRPSRVRPN